MELKKIRKFIFNLFKNIPFLGRHSMETSIISSLISKEIDESLNFNISFASFIHDIGFTLPNYSKKLFKNFINVEEFLKKDLDSRNRYLHSQVGAYLISKFFNDCSFDYISIVLLHHSTADELNRNKKEHLLANIVSFADKVAINSYKVDRHLLKNQLIEIFKTQKDFFFKDVYEAGMKVIERDIAFWLLEDIPQSAIEFLEDVDEEVEMLLNIEELLKLGEFVHYLVDSKSRFTRYHSESIAKLSSDIGKEFELSDEIVQYLYIAGLFHDVGKFLIPNHILEKSGVLNTKEMYQMKKHIFYSELLLKDLKCKTKIPWVDWAIQHHERLDGSGYPRKLTSKDFSLEAKILQISDVFVALTEERPYRKALSYEKALEILEEEVKIGKLDFEVFRKLKIMIKNGYEIQRGSNIDEILWDIDKIYKERSLYYT